MNAAAEVYQALGLRPKLHPTICTSAHQTAKKLRLLRPPSLYQQWKGGSTLSAQRSYQASEALGAQTVSEALGAQTTVSDAQAGG